MVNKNEIQTAGESIAQKLKNAGYDTPKKIALADLEDITKRTKLDKNVLKTIIAAAIQKIKIIKVKKIKVKPKRKLRKKSVKLVKASAPLDSL